MRAVLAVRPKCSHRCVSLKETSSRWTFRIFFIFFCSGEGKGEPEAPGRGRGRFFIENPRRGVSQERRGGGGRGAGKVSAGNLGGGG